ncbi:MAG: tetratricopeptide repeat protein [Candidatus Zixiibacteriota bacterium]|nr:MAG: tetratricopeptide repeat protein [candidate division Zixibacteria bacterium]
MYGKVKLTKRQIKEDKFTTFMLTAKHQFLENWQFFVIGIAAVVLVIVAVVYYFNSQQVKKQEAAEAYSRALMDYRTGNSQVAMMSLDQILEDYAGTTVAEQATFLLGKLNYEGQNYAEALRYFQMYADNYHDSKFRRASALAGIAGCYENEGNFLQAAQTFAAAIAADPGGPLNGDHHLAAMRNYLAAGDLTSARTHLDVIKDEFKGTGLEPRALRLFAEKSRS